MSDRPSAKLIVEQMKQAGVEIVVNVPDKMTSAIVDVADRDPALKVIRVCKEDEGASICGALSFGNKRAALVIQHTGVLDSVNNIMEVASHFRLPLVMIVGLLEKEPGVKPTESKRYGIRITEPILDLLQIPHVLVEKSGDEGSIAALIEEAYATPRGVAILVGREVA